MKLRETEYIELKREFNDSIEKEMVAFLNTSDGEIYIGIDDDGEIVGIDNIDNIHKKIAGIITMKILPNPQEFIELKSMDINGKLVAIINIKKGKGLYHIKKFGISPQGCYIRMGTTCRSMTLEQIENMNKFSNPQIISIKSPIQNLTFEQFKSILTYKKVYINTNVFEKKFALLTEDGSYNYMAFLLSDQCNVSIKVVRFRGNDKSEFISRKEFGECCIIKAMMDALQYSFDVLNIIQTNIVGAFREDTPFFNEDAFREAWINAVCHNDWFDCAPPAIYGFDDRVEIISQGKLIRGMTQEEFFKGVSKPVNKELARIFTMMHLSEQSGKGVPCVVEKYGKNVYNFGSSFIQCIIPYNIIDKNKINEMKGIGISCKMPDKMLDKMPDKNLENIINLIKNKPNITIIEIISILNISDRTVRGILSKLKKEGKIKRKGSNKIGYWEIIE